MAETPHISNILNKAEAGSLVEGDLYPDTKTFPLKRLGFQPDCFV